MYNHANGSDVLFREPVNYRFFLEKYRKYLYDVVDTYAYCLMGNHFHLMIRVKDLKTSKVFENLGGLKDDLEVGEKVSKVISQRVSNLFNSYTKAFNKKYRRMGSLFAPNVRRKIIDNDKYFSDFLVYIHQNPVMHGFVDNISDWKYSSYYEITNKSTANVDIESVMNWFGDLPAFKRLQIEKRGLNSVFD